MGDGAKLGDILGESRVAADPMQQPAQEDSAQALFAAIVQRYGVRPEDLVKEIEGPGVLARIARDVFGWSEPVKPKRGRPRKDGPNWALFLAVTSARQSGSTLGQALTEVAARMGDDPDDKEFERLKKAYRRAKDRWGEWPEREVRLTDFYGPIPDGLGDKNPRE